MIEEILPGLFRIEVPLPGNPLRSLNSYVVKSPERSLIIDTGMNRKECREALENGLAELEVDLNRTDFFITHMHADHLGLVVLRTPTSRVYFNALEVPIVNAEQVGRQEHWQGFHSLYLRHGFPEAELMQAADSHPGRRYGSGGHINFTTVKDGDNINVGDYSFRCIATPGHSPGHICLYEARKKILVSGDHILFDITPNITSWTSMLDALKQYLLSLDKVYSLDVRLTLPGHRSLMPDHKKRIREIQAHHQARLNETLAALRDGAKTAFQVAPYISWDIKCDSWEAFPPQQKWFAFGETLAHLYYLEGKGLVRQKVAGGKAVFSLA